ncbi:MAG TPA: sigma-54 dependent transcriptional regulator [Candidatus Binataceae bacterium]|nr:sigma-54 dependent transcriptional regulator [Candidatus Binataceae bacterium]
MPLDAIAIVPGPGGIVGCARAMQVMLEAIRRVAPYKGTVLVIGESGSGKELVTRALHLLGPNPNGPFVAVNCSNLVDGLAESQLFGHVKGAFTHAREAHNGYFREANGGTLFLDEIGELPLAMQAKLLRATESLEVQPVGSSETYRVDVRVLAATNRDLRAMVKAGEFRADLYYRLDVVQIRIPPLRERREDIALLTAHLARVHGARLGRTIRWISSGALAALEAYRWPGNVRELSHVIERSIMFAEGDRIDLTDLPAELIASSADDSHAAVTRRLPPNELQTAPSRSNTLEAVLKETVERSLRVARGDCAEAARLLGISRPAIYRKMARLGINNASLRQFYGRQRGPSRGLLN